MSRLESTIATGRRATALALALIGALTVSAGPATPASNRGTAVSIRLVSPTDGSVIARYGASPLFRWRIVPSDGQVLHGSGRLELSTSPTFAQEAIMRFDCGYRPGDCPTQYRWGTAEPHWYDMANSCTDVPPVGNCTGISKVVYWRVRFEPVGSRSYSSRVGVLRRSLPDGDPTPSARAEDGSTAYGDPAHFLFWVSDPTGVTRFFIQLYSGSKFLYGARTDWQSGAGPYETYVDLPLPPTIEAGSYRYCVEVLDQSDSSARDCASYTIT